MKYKVKWNYFYVKNKKKIQKQMVVREIEA